MNYESLKCECHDADKTFSNQPNLSQHIKRFHDPYYEPLKCELCPNSTTFSYQTHLTAHMKRSHDPDYEPLLCLQCGTPCSTQSNLTEHMKIHAPDRELFPCPILDCPTPRMVRRSSVRRHLKDLHFRTPEEIAALVPAVSAKRAT